MHAFMLQSDIVEANGKTARENNLARPHLIPLDALVEIDCPESEFHGVRAFVVEHARDCDGTPLYSLSFHKTARVLSNKANRFPPFTPCQVIRGWSDHSLRVVR
jgi:hypothetical protein